MWTRSKPLGGHDSISRPNDAEWRVIGLRDSPRLATFYGQKGASRFRTFDAVDTRDGSVPAGFDLGRFMLRYERPPLPGEVGCVLSHLAVMREFSEGTGEEDDVLVIAEDDCMFSDLFVEHYPKVAAAARSADILMLSNVLSAADGRFYDRGAVWLTFSPLGRWLFWSKPRTARWVGLAETRTELCTICYAVTRRAAGRLTQLAAQGVYWVADDHRVVASLGLRVFHVRPYLAQQNPGEASVIREHAVRPVDGDPSWRARVRLRTRLKRLWPSLRLGVRDIAQRIQHRADQIG